MKGLRSMRILAAPLFAIALQACATMATRTMSEGAVRRSGDQRPAISGIPGGQSPQASAGVLGAGRAPVQLPAQVLVVSGIRVGGVRSVPQASPRSRGIVYSTVDAFMELGCAISGLGSLSTQMGGETEDRCLSDLHKRNPVATPLPRKPIMNTSGLR
ncbi:MAG: hypothetical protein ABI681_06790 [Gemmatimonadales bacterium]